MQEVFIHFVKSDIFVAHLTDLTFILQRKDSMEFLHDIVPKKVKFSEYLKMMEEEKSDDEE